MFDRGKNFTYAPAGAAADIEDAFVAVVAGGDFESIDDIVNENEIANDGAVTPHFNAFTVNSAPNDFGNQALPFDRNLKRSKGIGDPQNPIIESVKPLV